MFELDISQAGLNAAVPLQGTLPQQLPPLYITLGLASLRISGPGITGKLPPWVLQVANTVEVTNTSITGPLPSIAAGAHTGAFGHPYAYMRISGNPKLSGTLPPSWGSVLRPFENDLSNNAPSGTILDTWSTPSIQRINLTGNKLSGSISRAWEKSPRNLSLRFLDVSGNAGMKGCLPEAKGQPWKYLPFINTHGTRPYGTAALRTTACIVQVWCATGWLVCCLVQCGWL